MAKCEIELDRGEVFRQSGAYYINAIRCELEKGHRGLHRFSWWKWNDEYANTARRTGDFR